MPQLLTKLMSAGLGAGLANAFCADTADSQTATGTNQATAFETSTAIVRFTTVASGTGCLLDNGARGDAQYIVNAGANTLLVYPHVGGSINGAATNAAFSLAAGSWAGFDRYTDTAWVGSSNDAANTTFTPSGIGARTTRSVQAKEREIVSVIDYLPDATPEGYGATTDWSAAFTAALAASNYVHVPRTTTLDANTAQTIYRLDSEVQVTDNKKLSIDRGVILRRYSLANGGSASSTPVLTGLGIGWEIDGGTIQTENASPNGIARLGHIDSTDNRNAWWWRFTNCTVLGRVGVAAGDIAVNVPSGQVTNPTKANYFGCIQNINIQNADIGLLLDEMANAHTGVNLQFWNCRTANFRIRGAYGNCFSNIFFHQGFASGVIGIDIRNKVSGTQDPTMNNIIGFVDETVGAADIPYFLDTAAANNTLIGTNNTLTTGTNNATGSNTILVGGVSPVFAFANNLTVGNGVARGTLTAKGGNIGLSLSGAGSGTIQLLTNGSNALQVEVLHTSLATNNLTLTGSAGGNPTIGVSGGSLAITPAVVGAASLTAQGGTAIPAGGTAGAGVMVSSTANFGVFFGSGVPTLSAAKGSLYMRSDGTTTTSRMYVNTDGGTTWTAVTTVA